MNTIQKSKRPPIIAIAGHIDHGKTTLLNYIKKTENPEKEHGGITQYIKAYNIKTEHGNMTLIDTPGHFAFNSIRDKSIQICDIMLLLIAIDDGIKPQTIEAIESAQKYNIPIIIAINKIDKSDNENKKEKIISDLSKFNLIPEMYGGDTFFSYISAKNGNGIPNLIENIHIQAEILDLKANFDCEAEGIILDNEINQKKGTITSIIVLNGKLKNGDMIKTNKSYGKIKLIIDENKVLKEATPSMHVKIIGLQHNQEIGSTFKSIIKEKKEKKILQNKNVLLQTDNKKDIESLIKKLLSNDQKHLNLIIKADVQGSLDVLKNSITNLSKNNIKINFIKSDLGFLTKSDIDLAIITKSQIIGFNTKIPTQINKIAQINKIKVNIFNIIYDIIDYINNEIKEIINENKKENIIGIAEVKKIFNQDVKNVIAGCIVTQGKIKQNSNIKIIRKNNIIYKGQIESLKILKQPVQEVTNGNECGIIIKDYNNIQINDKIKAYFDE
jgi:translation initiation factor IF-2